MGDGAENDKTSSELLVSTELDSERVTGVRVISPTNEVHMLLFMIYIEFDAHLICTYKCPRSVVYGVNVYSSFYT